MTEERETDLIDLLAEVLKHWKGALVFLLVGAIAFGTYSYMRSASEEEINTTERKAVDIALEYENLYFQAKEQSDIESVIELNKVILDSIKGFNDAQLQYFAENSVSDLWKDIYAASATENMSNQELKAHKISVKMTVIGAVVLCFLYLLMWFIKYIFDKCIKSSDDMNQLVGTPNLGKIVTVKEPHCFIDKALFKLKHHGERVFDVDKAVELLATNISVILNRKDFTRIAIVGSNLETKAIDYCDKIATILEDSCHIETSVLNDVVYNQQALETLGQTESVVLVETVGSSTYSDLAKEVQAIKQLDIEILGGIIVE